MGVFDCYCFICGGPIRSPNKSPARNDFPKPVKSHNWLNNLYILDNQNKLISASGSDYNESGVITVKNVEYELILDTHIVVPAIEHYGVVCHRDCYSFIAKNMDIKLLFGHVVRLLMPYSLLKSSKYLEMKKYVFAQDFDYSGILAKSPWLLESPLSNTRNAERIKKIWSNYVQKFKKDGLRPSPSESAALLPVGFVGKGNDGGTWVVKGKPKKWMRSNSVEMKKK